MTPGWDCHGLPIEQEVEKKIGKEKKKLLSTDKFRELCRNHASKFVDLQRDSFKELGITADWDNPYVTMDFKFEANIYRTLCEVAKKGLLVERHKPIFWSWGAQTALADAEVEYKDKEDYSIYVNFELSDESKKTLSIDSNAGLVIWTTTPWTIPSNTGIALNPDEEYVLSSDGFIVAKERYQNMIDEKVISGNITRVFSSTELENLFTVNPLNNRPSKIILGEHVLMTGGSGCVHTAPGHGEEDYKVGLKYDLDVVMPVDERGCYDESILGKNLLPEEFVNMHILKANEPILELLGKSLLKQSKFVHSYPHCWRTKTPLIYRATNQWFISIDESNPSEKSLRDRAITEIDAINFYPESSKNRLKPMLEGRPDWCISRQRSWGVPIAFFRSKKTKEVIFDLDVLENIASIFDVYGADAWYSMSIKELLPENSKYNYNDLEKVNDILDVWFDSGSTWNSVLASGNYDAGEYPADLYVEGSDQHRGWFQSSLLLSTAINGKAPYKNLITHGFTMDAKGEKQSKSKGNVTSPNTIVKQYGSEILRLWVALSDYQSDQKISDEILKQTAEQYRKIRNTFRFLLANTSDLTEVIQLSEYNELDKWILVKANDVFSDVKESFDNYDFIKGLSILNNFITNELSGIFMDITKDRLYCEDKNESSRRSTQSAMFHIAKAMLGLLAPVLTYTADEVLDYSSPLFKGDMKNIFDLVYEPVPVFENDSFNDSNLIEAREKFSEVVDSLKKDKVIKSTLELQIIGDVSFFPISGKNLEDWFVVSSLDKDCSGEKLTSFTIGEKSFDVYKANNFKCDRCWRFVSSKEDVFCKRCSSIV